MMIVSKRREWLLFACLFLAALLTTGVCRAATGSEGKDFYLAFQPNYGGIDDLSLFISGTRDTQGTVEIAGLNFKTTFQIHANQITTIAIPSAAGMQPVDKVSRLTVHVTAEDKVSVVGFNRRSGTTDGFLALPTDALGLEYYALSYPGYTSSQLTVIGAYDATQVSITPVSTMGSHTAGKTFTLTLNQGESYMLTSNGEISGTRVVASAPVVVMAGADAALIPSGYSFLDHIVETMPPLSTWGKSFLTVPLATRTRGDMFRVLASQDNTQVSINGSLVATLKRGAIFERIVTARSQITASAPVLVTQFSLATSYDGVDGDPFAMTIPPTEQFLDHYTFSTPNDNGFPRQFVNVVVPTGEMGSLELDGVAVDLSKFSPIANSGFSGAQLPVGPGSHSLRSRNQVPFGIYVYGFGYHDSYGYPGGMSFEAINPVGDAYAPALRLNVGPDTVQGLATDSEDANANGVLDAGEDMNGNGTIDRRDEDRDHNGRLDSGEDSNGNGVLDRDTGVFKVELMPGASNLKLDVLPFVPGAAAVQFTVSRIALDSPGTGVVLVSDGAGNKATAPVGLGLVKVMKNLRVVATLPAAGIDVDMASFKTAPFSVARDGERQVIEWRFDDFSVDKSMNLDFDVVLRNPVGGESRQVSRSVDLYYTDEAGKEQHTALEPRVVQVLASKVAIVTSIDKPHYSAADTVRLTATVNNLSPLDSSIGVRLSLRDAANVLVKDLGLLPARSIAGGATANFESPPLSLSGLYAGSYRIVAEAIGQSQTTLASSVAAFDIAADSASMASVTIAADRQSYSGNQPLLLEVRVTNPSVNQALDGVSVVTTILNPDGSPRTTRSDTIAQLAPAGARSFSYSIPLAGAPAGRYTALVRVTGAAGVQLAQASTGFALTSSADNGAGLSGSVVVLPASAPLGMSAAFAYEVRNAGNAALDGLALSLSVVDPKQQSVLAEFPATISLPMGGIYKGSVNWIAEGPVGATHVAVLRATVAGKTIVLGQTNVALAPAPVQLELSQVLGTRGAVLALVSADDKQAAGRRAFVDQMLAASGRPYAVVADQASFVRALRSGLYGTVWVSGSQDKLQAGTVNELRELVFGGAGLVIDAVHDQRNGALDAIAGVRYRGKDQAAPGPVAIGGPQFDTRELNSTGAIERIDLIGATAQANFRGTAGGRGSTALATNAYGQGHSTLFALDLASSAAAVPGWQDVFGETLRFVRPPLGKVRIPGEVVQVETTLSNLNRTEDLRVHAALPVGALAIDAGLDGVPAADRASVDWAFTLPSGTSKQLALTLRLANQAGQSALKTTVNVARDGVQAPYGDALEVAFATTTPGEISAAVLDDLEAIPVQGAKERAARDAAAAAVKQATNAMTQNTPFALETAIAALADAGGRLEEIASSKAELVRAGIGQLLKQAQWRWSTMQPKADE